MFYTSMDLEKFFLVTNLQKRAFAQMVNISESALNNYIHKRRTPRLDIAYRIVRATKGKVTIEDLLK